MNRYHIHVYFDADQPDQLDTARQLRQQLAERFALPVGTLHGRPVGPHPSPMFQALLGGTDLELVLPWLMQQRGDLNILIHGDSGDDLADHTQHVMWLGASQSLRLDRL